MASWSRHGMGPDASRLASPPPVLVGGAYVGAGASGWGPAAEPMGPDAPLSSRDRDRSARACDGGALPVGEDDLRLDPVGDRDVERESTGSGGPGDLDAACGGVVGALRPVDAGARG